MGQSCMTVRWCLGQPVRGVERALSWSTTARLWFGRWFLLTTGRFDLPLFDPFPYGLLTMVVSLEAIFLVTFVLISQNRLSAEAEYRADLDLHIRLLIEHELTRGCRCSIYTRNA
jgi:uncharacterized membrane protein